MENYFQTRNHGSLQLGFRALLVVSFILFESSPAWSNESCTYRVQKNDTISEILYRLNLRPIYGRQGTLAQVLDLNPTKKINSHTILPGEKLRLPGSDCNRLAQTKPASQREALVSNQAPLPKTMPERGPSSVESTPESTGAVALKSEEATSSREASGIRLSVGGTYTSIEATDSQSGTVGRLSTSLSPRLEAAWTQFWSETWQSEFFFHWTQYNFEEVPGKTVSGAQQSTSGLGFALNHKMTDQLSLSSSLSLSDRIFYRTVASDVFALEKISAPRWDLKGQWALKRSQLFELGLEGAVFTNSTASKGTYSVSGSFGQGAGLYLSEKRKNFLLQGHLFYQADSYSVNDVKFQRRDLKGMVELRWGWPGNQP